MPIVSGNEPPSGRNTRGSLLGWIFPLLFFGPMIYNVVRGMTRSVLTDQQLLIIGGGLIGLTALILIARRVSQSRAGSSASLPTSYTPPRPPTPAALPKAYRADASKQYIPQPPRFEPIITGKVFLAGLLLAALMAGVGFLLLSASI